MGQSSHSLQILAVHGQPLVGQKVVATVGPPARWQEPSGLEQKSAVS